MFIRFLYKFFIEVKLLGIIFLIFIVEGKIILELKTCNIIHSMHCTQIINYLSATGLKVGYILNFGNMAKLEFQRIVH